MPSRTEIIRTMRKPKEPEPVKKDDDKPDDGKPPEEPKPTPPPPTAYGEEPKLATA